MLNNLHFNYSHVIRRLNNLYKNIGSDTKFGKNNMGKLRKRYQTTKTGTVIQGVDTPAELFNHSNLLIKGNFYIIETIIVSQNRKILENGHTR